MKQLRETFTDAEFKKLYNMKQKLKMTWHDFILTLTEKGVKR